MNAWWTWGLVFARVATVGMILGAGWWYIQSAEKVRRDNVELTQQVADQQEMMAASEEAFQICLAVNASNYEQALAYRAIAEQAAQEVILLRQQSDELVAALKKQSEDFRNDQGCRKLSDPLPTDFVEWLRN